nr:MAG TPA: hypothetical protein [Caudoviricetes sp.]
MTADGAAAAGGTPGRAIAAARGGHGRQLLGLGLAAPAFEGGC